jgi:hypothetical protein
VFLFKEKRIMMNNFKAESLNSIRERLGLYSLVSAALPSKVDGTSSGYQCICKITNRDHFTLYHSGKLDGLNEYGLEIAFSSTNIATSLEKPKSIVGNWLQRVSSVLPAASPKTSHKYPRVGVIDDGHVRYLISQLDFLYGISQPNRKSFSLRPNRPEQAAFRASMLSAYGGACMITGCNDVEVLEACHIVPDSMGGKCLTNNGLLLRADLHKLFDEGLMSINPDSGEVHFSKKVTSKEYVEMATAKFYIRLPKNQNDCPDYHKIAEHFNLYFSP